MSIVFFTVMIDDQGVLYGMMQSGLRVSQEVVCALYAVWFH